MLARRAAQAILEIRQHAVGNPQQKADRSPVTAADLAADAVLRDGLAGAIASPDDLIVTEESWQTGVLPPRGRIWVVDPLDGTEDFVAGRRDYAVQVGLVVDGQPVLGVVCQPATGTVWRGVIDAGHRRCERVEQDGTVVPCVVAEGALLAGAPRIASSISHPSSLVRRIIEELGATAVPMGSVGLKIGAIVDGRVDAYVSGSRHIKVWDTGGPAAILLAAGGVVTGLSQRPLRYAGDVAHDDGICAWTPAARGLLLPRLQEVLERLNHPATAR